MAGSEYRRTKLELSGEVGAPDLIRGSFYVRMFATALEDVEILGDPWVQPHSTNSDTFGPFPMN